MNKNLRKEIWTALNGVRFDAKLVKKISTDFGIEKARQVMDFFETATSDELFAVLFEGAENGGIVKEVFTDSKACLFDKTVRNYYDYLLTSGVDAPVLDFVASIIKVVEAHKTLRRELKEEGGKAQEAFWHLEDARAVLGANAAGLFEFLKEEEVQTWIHYTLCEIFVLYLEEIPEKVAISDYLIRVQDLLKERKD